MKFNPYEELGIEKDATEEEVRKAYRQRAKATHPDAGGSEQAFERTGRALAILTHPRARKTFDETGQAEDIPPDNAYTNALSLIMTHIIGYCVNQERVTEMDLFVNIAQILQKQQAELIDANNKLRWTMDRLRKVQKRIRRKQKGEPNLIERMIERQLGEAEAQMRVNEVGVADHKLALEICREYEFDKEISQWSSTMFSQTASGNGSIF